MKLISYFNMTFNLSVKNIVGFTYIKIYPAVFLTINKNGLYVDIVKPKFIDITKHYIPTKKRIDAMKDLLGILKWN